jgi:hypothetical protein
MQVLSELLSCISSMFVVVLDCPDALNPILHKIFSALSTGMAIINKLLFENRDIFLGQRSKLVIPCALCIFFKIRIRIHCGWIRILV